MNRFDRALAILLLLRDGRTLSASALAQRLEVSKRTIYRDIETLSEVGVPVYAETGREGGFRLVEGYFLPPIALSVGEATSLLIGLTLLAGLRTKPFVNDLEMAKRKLLAIMPDQLRDTLAHAEWYIGFEAIPTDIWHPERSHTVEINTGDEGQVITTFLQGIFRGEAIALDYFSPYSHTRTSYLLTPLGMIWDRDQWYLVGNRLDRNEQLRFWRADRVENITLQAHPTGDQPDFDVNQLLGRKWLDQAIMGWTQTAPVKIRMTSAQADRVRQDWYYSHADFKTLPSGDVLMTFGESNPAFVFELLRWLGVGAELIEPQAWRTTYAAELRSILSVYE